jgi:hypothetical protein
MSGVHLPPTSQDRERGGDYHAAHDHSTQFYIAHTLFFFAGVTLVVAVIGLTRLVRPSHPKAAVWGGLLSLMGLHRGA